MKISELPILSTPSSDTYLPVIDGGTSYQLAANELGGNVAGGHEPEIITLDDSTNSVVFSSLIGSEYEIDARYSTDSNGYTQLILNGNQNAGSYRHQDLFSIDGTTLSYSSSNLRNGYGYGSGLTVTKLSLFQMDSVQVFLQRNSAWTGPTTVQNNFGSTVAAVGALSSIEFRTEVGAFLAGSIFKLTRIA